MSLNFYRFFNKYRIIVTICFFTSLFISNFIINGLYDLTFGFDFSAEDIALAPHRAQQMLISQKTTMDCYADVYLYIMVVIPLLSFALAGLFLKEKTGFFQYSYARGRSYKKVVLSAMFSNAAITALFFFVCYLIYFTIGYCIFGSRMNLARTNFDCIFGKDFSLLHTYWYYVAEGFMLYFTPAFIYSWLACAVGMLTQKKHHIILLPACFYFGFSIIIGYILPPSGLMVQLFQPFKFVYISLNMWTTGSALDILYAFMPQLLPLVLALVLTVVALQKGEKTDG